MQQTGTRNRARNRRQRRCRHPGVLPESSRPAGTPPRLGVGPVSVPTRRELLPPRRFGIRSEPQGRPANRPRRTPNGHERLGERGTPRQRRDPPLHGRKVASKTEEESSQLLSPPPRAHQTGPHRRRQSVAPRDRGEQPVGSPCRRCPARVSDSTACSVRTLVGSPVPVPARRSELPEKAGQAPCRTRPCPPLRLCPPPRGIR